MLSIARPCLSQLPAHELERGCVVNIDDGPNHSSIVESCEEQGPNVIVKLIGEAPLLLSKDRRVSVFRKPIGA